MLEQKRELRLKRVGIRGNGKNQRRGKMTRHLFLYVPRTEKNNVFQKEKTSQTLISSTLTLWFLDQTTIQFQDIAKLFE